MMIRAKMVEVGGGVEGGEVGLLWVVWLDMVGEEVVVGKEEEMREEW